MFDIPSHCETREAALKAVGIHITEILQKAGVDRSSWTGWKRREIRPRLDKWMRVEAEIDRALAEAAGDTA